MKLTILILCIITSFYSHHCVKLNIRNADRQVPLGMISMLNDQELPNSNLIPNILPLAPLTPPVVPVIPPYQIKPFNTPMNDGYHTYLNLGSNYIQQGDFSTGLDYYTIALDKAEADSDYNNYNMVGKLNPLVMSANNEIQSNYNTNIHTFPQRIQFSEPSRQNEIRENTSSLVENEEEVLNKIISDLKLKKENLDKIEPEIVPEIEKKLKNKNVDSSKSDKFIKKFNKVMKKLKELKEEKKLNKKNSSESKKIYIKINSGDDKEHKLRNKTSNSTINNHSNSNSTINTHSNNTLISQWIKKHFISNYKQIDLSKFIVHAKIKSNENLLKIDKKLILSKNHPELLKLCSRIQSIPSFRNNFDKICMSVFILKDKSEDSELKKYFTLENFSKITFSSFPIFFKGRESKIMKGTIFNLLVKTRRDLFEKEYNILSENRILKKSEIELKDFIKSRLYVTSRNINISSNLSAIVPLIDNLPHREKSNIKFNYKKNNSQFELNSERIIEKGEELAQKLVSMSNDNLLLYYGYTIPNNKLRSEIFIEITVNNKITVNSTSANVSFPENILLRSDYDLNKVISAFRRILNGNHNSSVLMPPISFENELLAINLLKKATKSQLDKYKTNFQSDIIILRNSRNLTNNEKNIYRVIIEEKKRVKAYYILSKFFDNIFKKINNGLKIEEQILRKISSLKSYKKYYTAIINILKKNADHVDRNYNNQTIQLAQVHVNKNNSLSLQNGDNLITISSNITNPSKFNNQTVKPANKLQDDEEEDEDDEDSLVED